MTKLVHRQVSQKATRQRVDEAAVCFIVKKVLGGPWFDVDAAVFWAVRAPVEIAAERTKQIP